MKLNDSLSHLRAVEERSIIEHYRQRGESDGRRYYPSTDAEAIEVVAELSRDIIDRSKQHEAGEIQFTLSQVCAAASAETIRADDDRRALQVEINTCAIQLEGRARAARPEYAAASARIRETRQALAAFRELHKDRIGGRDPWPEPSPSLRMWRAQQHLLVMLVAWGIEFTSFVLLGHDAMREAIVFGLIGGTVSAAWVWCLRHLLIDDTTSRGLGGRGRTHAAIGVTMVVATLFAYQMGCIRDGLLAINNEGHLTLDQILVPPGQLSPESALVFALSVALMLLTWLLSLGRRNFAFEDAYRRLHQDARDAELAYPALQEAIHRDVIGIDAASRKKVDELVSARESGRIQSSAAFGDAQRQLRQLHVRVHEARKLAVASLQAYASANRAMRGAGNPLPAALTHAMPFDPTPGMERDLLEGFRRNLEHARSLAGEARSEASRSLHALGRYASEILRHVSKLAHDPLMQEEPPRFDDLLLLEEGVAAFPDPARREPSSAPGCVERFLGVDEGGQ